jgi:hypothetical protein
LVWKEVGLLVETSVELMVKLMVALKALSLDAKKVAQTTDFSVM